MPLKLGQPLPEITLKQKTDAGLVDVNLRRNVGKGKTVILFVPLAFTGVCTDELCKVTGLLDEYKKLGADVIAIDKAPLEPRVAAMPGVEWRGESAFALDPASVGAIDWLFSDVICYPARLLKLVERWRATGQVKNFVCTIKFQGETDHETTEAFAAIPGAQVLHLHNNKHELTFALLAGSAEAGTP